MRQRKLTKKQLRAIFAKNDSYSSGQTLAFEVNYNKQRQAVFNNEVDAMRYIRKQARDPNANVKQFSIKQI